MDEFRLGIPSLVCRWRLANGKLPLQSRHIRALGARRIDGKALSPALIAWVKQRVEWGLEGTNAHPDGVLMLVIDEEGKSALSLGPYRPLKGVSANDLLERAIESRREGLNTGVAPEELWLVRDDTLIWATSSEFAPAGAVSLIYDLARSMGMPVCRDENLLEEVSREGWSNSEVFLASDEHGVIPASDHSGLRASKFAQSYVKLLSRK